MMDAVELNRTKSGPEALRRQLDTRKNSIGFAIQVAIEETLAAVERLRGPHYVCRSCGYHPGNRAEWCAVGCGSDYNKMHKVALDG